MKGTVAPSSSSAAAAVTCASRTPSSCAICPSIEVVTPAPSYAPSTICCEAEPCVRSEGMHMAVAPVILQVPAILYCQSNILRSSPRTRDPAANLLALKDWVPASEALKLGSLAHVQHTRPHGEEARVARRLEPWLQI